jgi:two-component system NtrC family sensor kinase
LAVKEMISVQFEDTGSGIQPMHLAKIFEPLFTTKARGTGLGLAISNNIIVKHHGSIEVASKMGKGTTFTIKIPLHHTAEEASHDIQ